MIKITPDMAGKALGISGQAVRVFLQLGKLPFGAAAKMPGSDRWTYVIYPRKFAEYVAEFDGTFVKLEDILEDLTVPSGHVTTE